MLIFPNLRIDPIKLILLWVLSYVTNVQYPLKHLYILLSIVLLFPLALLLRILLCFVLFWSFVNDLVLCLMILISTNNFWCEYLFVYWYHPSSLYISPFQPVYVGEYPGIILKCTCTNHFHSWSSRLHLYHIWCILLLSLSLKLPSLQK
jgi:hypothetical protein